MHLREIVLRSLDCIRLGGVAEDEFVSVGQARGFVGKFAGEALREGGRLLVGEARVEVLRVPVDLRAGKGAVSWCGAG